MKKVQFSENIEIFLEDPDSSHDLKLSRMNSGIIFRNDCLLRYKKLLTPILTLEHREKIRKYIQDQKEIQLSLTV